MADIEMDVDIPDEIRARYIERRKKDLESLRQSLARKSFEEFKRIGHQLKGNAASFGYRDLEKVAIELEEAGEKQDIGLAGLLVSRFAEWLEQVSSPKA